MFSRLEEEIELLERHMKILKLVIENEPIGIIKLSEKSGMPQHKIRYSLRVLEHNGMIKPSQRGAVTTEEAKHFLAGVSQKLSHLLNKINEKT